MCKRVTVIWALPFTLLFSVGASSVEGELLSATVDYEEVGGPKDEVQNVPVGDLFTITNDSSIGELASVSISLGNGLLFDTDIPLDTAGTAPSFDFVGQANGPTLLNGAIVPDGSQTLALTFSNFGPGQTYSFSIDVDRTGQQNDNQNRHVIGNVLNALLTVSFTGAFPGPITLTQQFNGQGDTADGTVSITVVPEPATNLLASAALFLLAIAYFRGFVRRPNYKQR